MVVNVLIVVDVVTLSCLIVFSAFGHLLFSIYVTTDVIALHSKKFRMLNFVTVH